MHKLTSALRAVARYIYAKEPVLTGGAVAGVVLGVVAWFGWIPSTQAHEAILAVCNFVAPILTAFIARFAAYSPDGHATRVVEAQADVASTFTLAQGFPAAMVSQTAQPPVPALNGRLDGQNVTVGGDTGISAATPAAPKPAKRPAAKKAPAKKNPATKKAK